MSSLRASIWTLVLVPAALFSPQLAWGSSADAASAAAISPPPWYSGLGLGHLPGPAGSPPTGAKTPTSVTDLEFPLAESTDDSAVSDPWDAWQSWSLLTPRFDMGRVSDSVRIEQAVRSDEGLQSLSFPPSPRAPPAA